MLKFTCTEAELPTEPAIRALYNDDGTGTYVLQVDGAVPKARLDEFRTSNLKLKGEKEALETQLAAFADVDVERYQALLAKSDEIEGSKAKTDEQIKALVEQRTAAMLKTHAAEKAKLEERLTKVNAELSREKIDRTLIEAGTKLGLRKEASADLVSRGRGTFTLDDAGNLVAKGPDGEVVYGNAGQPLTVDEYVAKLTKEAGHLFDESAGSGAPGGRGGKGAGAEDGNPWHKDTWNLTKQGQILLQDREKAKRLAAQAGKTIS